MLKALIKKQLLEMLAGFFQNKKNGKKRSVAGIIGLSVLYLICFGMLSVFFLGTGYAICYPLKELGLDWLYFAFAVILSMTLSVFGSVFNTYSTVYVAKDNEFLLSMPIKIKYILAVRLFGVWFWGIFYEAIAMLPMLAVYWIMSSSGIGVILADILLFLTVSFLILTLSCLLGWVVAKVSERVKSKSFVTVLISLLFIAGYYAFYFKAKDALGLFISNADKLGQDIKEFAYPLYFIGSAGVGGLFETIVVVAVTVGLFALTWFVLSASFIKITTKKRGSDKRELKESDRTAKTKSVLSALFEKELRRFSSSATYMLNCGLSSFMFVVLAIVIVVKGNELCLTVTAALPKLSSHLPFAVTAMLCLVSSMNIITAPSVSLEGKNIWLVQTFPVDMWQVLKAKLLTHLLITGIPAELSILAAIYVLRPEVPIAIMMLIMPLLFILLCAEFGLVVNLKMPNLNWTNESIPIKQSVSSLIAIFGNMILSAITAVPYIFVGVIISPLLYFVFASLLISAVDVCIIIWLKSRGTKIFAYL